MKHANIITKLTLEQKCALLSGETVFTTRGYKNAGIPSITLSDGPNGVRKQAGAADHLGLNPSVPATCFPTAATVACSWDPALGEQLGQAMGEEAAAQEVSVLLGPGLNTKRSPLCGRNFEYFSEDPYLSGKLAAAYVRGIQSNGIAACPKHFAVNSQELRRMASDSVVDERTLRELYLTGFEIVVKEAHPKTIMSSYNLVNGTYANENAHLLQDILRRDWGFDGAVVTDWGGSNDHPLGVKNGSTLEMPAPGGDAVRELLKAVETGKISESDVDARLDELLTLVLDTHAAVENHSRSPLCWLVWAVLTMLLNASYKRGKPNLNVIFQYNMPLRALAKMTNGAISMGMVDGIVLEAKGFWVIGLLKVIVEAVKNIILNAQLESRLRNS